MVKPGMKSKDTIESLKERMNRDPFSRAFLQLAEEFRKTGRYEEAIRVCQEGLARHPTYHTARISLGRTYLEVGDLQNARRALSEVLELAPENHLAGKLLAEVQRRTGDVAGAAETYRAILRHYPGDREIEALMRDLQGPRNPSPPAPSPQPAAPSPAAPGRFVQPPTLPAPPAPLEPAFDYRPEDLGPSVRATSQPGAAPAPRRDEAPPAPPSEEAQDDALQTNTLAELYLRQGMVDRALEVYRAMLRVDPANEKARRRLAELAPGAPATVLPPGPAFRQAAEHDTAELRAVPPIPGPQATRPPDSVQRLERWLARIRQGGAAARETRPR